MVGEGWGGRVVEASGWKGCTKCTLVSAQRRVSCMLCARPAALSRAQMVHWIPSPAAAVLRYELGQEYLMHNDHCSEVCVGGGLLLVHDACGGGR